MIDLVLNDVTHTVCGHPKPRLPNFKSDLIIEYEADVCGLAPHHASPCGNWLTLRATPDMAAKMMERGL